MKAVEQTHVGQAQIADKHRVWLIFSGLMLALLIASLDQTVVATALPTIVSDLGGLNQLSWVVTGYLLASHLSSPVSSLPPGFTISSAENAAAIQHLPPALHTEFVHAYAQSLSTVLLVVVPICAFAFLLTGCCQRCRCERLPRRLMWAIPSPCQRHAPHKKRSSKRSTCWQAGRAWTRSIAGSQPALVLISIRTPPGSCSVSRNRLPFQRCAWRSACMCRPTG